MVVADDGWDEMEKFRLGSFKWQWKDGRRTI